MRATINDIEQLMSGVQEERKQFYNAKFIIQDREDASSAIPGLTAEQHAARRQSYRRQPFARCCFCQQTLWRLVRRRGTRLQLLV